MAYATKPHQCKHCPETRPDKFDGNRKVICAKCYNRIRREQRAAAAVEGVKDLEDYGYQMQARANNELLNRVWRVG